MNGTSTNPKTYYPMTAIAGLASGVLFLALVSGASMMPVIGYFVQLPLFFVGFALGLSSAAMASAGSAAILIVAAGLDATLLFLLTQVLPVLVVVRYALWSRQLDKPGTLEWYPLGLLLGRLVVVVLAVTVGVLIWTKLEAGSLEMLFGQAMREFEAGLAGQGMPGGLTERLMPLAPFLPGIVACSWLVMVVINALAGQWLATRQGQALRPTPTLRELVLPVWILPAFALSAAAASILSGDFQFLVASAALILSIPVMFQGLAVIHTLVKRLSSPRLALTIFYVSMLVFAWPLFFAILGLGIIEPWARMRQRFAQ